jgi:uncharacterized phage-associated protein
MTPTSAFEVADFFIYRFQQAGEPITNLKLQKLLYYAQGWFLALKSKPLFSERVEAWPRGPVVPPVYGTFKSYQWNPINGDVSEPSLDPEIEAHLREIMEAYGVHGAYYLEKLSHQERPWLDARGNLGPTDFCTNVISHEAMKSFFQTQS